MSTRKIVFSSFVAGVTAAICLLAFVGSAQASLIAYDSFYTGTNGYVAGTPGADTAAAILNTQPGGTGNAYSSGYTGTYASAASSAGYSVTSGLTTSALGYVGNPVAGSVELKTRQFTGGSYTYKTAERPVATYAGTDTYYFSGLFKMPASALPAGRAAFANFLSATPGVSADIAVNTKGFSIGILGSDLVLRTYENGAARDHALLAGYTPGDQFLWSVKVDTQTNAFEVLLNPTDVTTEAQARTTSLADITFTANGGNGAFTRTATNTDIAYAGFNMIGTSAGDTTFRYLTVDEIRFGTDYASVVGVPEPATLGLLLMGGLGVLIRRKRN